MADVTKRNEVQAAIEAYAEDPVFQLAMLEESLINRVALRVMQLRKAQDLSQSDLAEKLGTQQPRVAQIEAGEANVQLRTLAQLSFALNCEPEDLVTETAPRYLQHEALSVDLTNLKSTTAFFYDMGTIGGPLEPLDWSSFQLTGAFTVSGAVSAPEDEQMELAA